MQISNLLGPAKFDFYVQKEEGLWGKLTAVGNQKEIRVRRERSLEAVREYSRKVFCFMSP